MPTRLTKVRSPAMASRCSGSWSSSPPNLTPNSLSRYCLMDGRAWSRMLTSYTLGRPQHGPQGGDELLHLRLTDGERRQETERLGIGRRTGYHTALNQRGDHRGAGPRQLQPQDQALAADRFDRWQGGGFPREQASH